MEITEGKYNELIGHDALKIKRSKYSSAEVKKLREELAEKIGSKMVRTINVYSAMIACAMAVIAWQLAVLLGAFLLEYLDECTVSQRIAMHAICYFLIASLIILGATFIAEAVIGAPNDIVEFILRNTSWKKILNRSYDSLVEDMETLERAIDLIVEADNARIVTKGAYKFSLITSKEENEDTIEFKLKLFGTKMVVNTDDAIVDMEVCDKCIERTTK